MVPFAIDRGAFWQCFAMFGNFVTDLWNRLDRFSLYQGVTLPRLLLGFVCLSALFGLFWKGIRG